MLSSISFQSLEHPMVSSYTKALSTIKSVFLLCMFVAKILHCLLEKFNRFFFSPFLQGLVSNLKLFLYF